MGSSGPMDSAAQDLYVMTSRMMKVWVQTRDVLCRQRSLAFKLQNHLCPLFSNQSFAGDQTRRCSTLGMLPARGGMSVHCCGSEVGSSKIMFSPLCSLGDGNDLSYVHRAESYNNHSFIDELTKPWEGNTSCFSSSVTAEQEGRDL